MLNRGSHWQLSPFWSTLPQISFSFFFEHLIIRTITNLYHQLLVDILWFIGSTGNRDWMEMGLSKALHCNTSKLHILQIGCPTRAFCQWSLRTMIWPYEQWENVVSPAKRHQTKMGGLQKRDRSWDAWCLSWNILQNWKTRSSLVERAQKLNFQKRLGSSVHLPCFGFLLNKSRCSYAAIQRHNVICSLSQYLYVSICIPPFVSTS